jgi:hypothetical protein
VRISLETRYPLENQITIKVYPKRTGKFGLKLRIPNWSKDTSLDVNGETQATPQPKAQRNFTDPESRTMKDGATKSFAQAYNAQAAVDGEAQVIVAADVTQEANDQQQLVPMLRQVAGNCDGPPAVASADSGYFSEIQVTDAIQMQAQAGRCYGVIFTGERYDTGTPLGLLTTSIAFALKRPDIAPGLREYMRQALGS